MDEAEDGNGGENILFGEWRSIGKRSAGDGYEDVDGYGHRANVAESEGKFYSLARRFAHADDAAGAYFEPGLSSGVDGGNLISIGVGGA